MDQADDEDGPDGAASDAASDAGSDASAGWDDPLLTTPTLPLPALVRACRHFARLSQRELAARVGVSKSHIGEIESGHSSAPSYPLVLRIVESTGLRLVAIDPFTLPIHARSYDNVLDRGGRRYPAHLDVEAVLDNKDWWFSRTRPGQRKRPAYTASWERNLGRRRRRRSPARIRADADAELAAALALRREQRNTPGGSTVSGDDDRAG